MVRSCRAYACSSRPKNAHIYHTAGHPGQTHNTVKRAITQLAIQEKHKGNAVNRAPLYLCRCDAVKGDGPLVEDVECAMARGQREPNTVPVDR
jgi:hypothetical protein